MSGQHELTFTGIHQINCHEGLAGLIAGVVGLFPGSAVYCL